MQPAQPTTDLRFLRCHAGGLPFCALLSEVHGLRGTEHVEIADSNGARVRRVRTAEGAVPAIALTRLLGLSATPGEARVFLLFGAGKEAWALGVEGISRPFSAPGAGTQLPLLEGRPVSPFFSAAAWDGERLLPILQADRLRRRSRGSAASDPSASVGSVSQPPTGHGRGAPAKRNGSAERTKLVLFSTPAARARSVVFGLCLVQVAEVLRTFPVWPLPGSAPYVRGLTRYGRQPVPVVDLDLRYGLGGAPPDAPGRLLLVRSRDGAAHVALVAGAEVRLQELASDQPAVSPASRFNGTPTRAVFSLPDRTLILPDVASLIQSRTRLDPSAQTRAMAQKGIAS
jgi:chemotaxis signal transduction protein